MKPLFANFDDSAAARGQAAFNVWASALLTAADPDLAQALARAAIEPVREPLFFSYFAAPNVSTPLEQLAYGYLLGAERIDRARVYSDADGVVHLPGVGYMSTAVASAYLWLYPSGLDAIPQLVDERGSCVSASFAAPVFIKNSAIEIAQSNDPLLTNLYHDERGGVHRVDVREVLSLQRCTQLATALDVICECCPWLHQLIRLVVRRVVLFHCPHINSFATLAAHGTAFLNVGMHDDEVCLVEDLAHQCGHVVFSALTFDREVWLTGDLDRPANSLGPYGDPRSSYVILHGVFTEAVMSLCLNECYTRGLLSSDKVHELLGRLAYILLRFERDLADLRRTSVLTPMGGWLVEQFENVFSTISAARRHQFRGLDLSGQSYSFNYRSFLARNPISRLKSCRRGF